MTKPIDRMWEALSDTTVDDAKSTTIAIDASRAALAATRPADPDLLAILYVLGFNLVYRYEQSGTKEDLYEAVAELRKGLRLTAPGDADRIEVQGTLVHALLDRYDRTGTTSDLDEAIDVGRAALAVTAPDHPDRRKILSDLGTALLDRFESTGTMADLDAAVEAGRASVAAISTDDPSRAMCLGNLGNALARRFEHRGSPADLDEAIEAGRAAVAAAAPDNPNRAGALSNLGVVLRLRSGVTEAGADLDEAIKFARAALAATAADDPRRGGYLSDLGNVLAARFHHTDSIADLDEAITVGRAALAVTSPEDPHYAEMLCNLGVSLIERYDRAGAVADLDETIRLERAAVDATRAHDIRHARYLSNLVDTLVSRFYLLGTLSDLDEAIETGRAAVAVSASDGRARATRLSTLSAALVARFERSATPADLDQAIEAVRAALASTAPDDHRRAAILTNFGRSLLSRFGVTGLRSDIDEAVESFRAALAAVGPDDHRRGAILTNLGGALLERFQQVDSAADLEEVVDVDRAALAAIPEDHPDRALCLFSLGNALLHRFERNPDGADLQAAGIEALRSAARVRTAPPSLRVEAAWNWGYAAALAGDWTVATAGYALAVELLARATPRALERGDQEFWLSSLAGLASEAAACFLQIGETGRALEMWEAGRGVLLAQALDTRTDLTQLREDHPDLAADFVRLRDALDGLGGGIGSTSLPSDQSTDREHGRSASVDRVVDRRREEAEQFEQLVEQVRAQPGFERFLLPPPLSKLLLVADEGPVVLVNVSAIRSDALLLRSNGVEVLRLSGLDPDAVRDRVTAFLDALDEVRDRHAGQSQREHAERCLTGVLEWLWDTVTGPVLERLGMIGSPDPTGAPWPRVWWCPSGLLTFLPLHAAGRHSTRFKRAPETVLDRVVSSYTPTIRALAYARRATPSGQESAMAAGLLIVAMPETPEAVDLPGAVEEAAMLQTLFGADTEILSGPDATRDRVEAALRCHRWAHFACHAASDAVNPSASHVLLHDHQDRPLTVVDVARLRLDAELAFLSACATARAGAQLADEAVQLAAAFQLAGYRQVIATLWPIGDLTALEVADAVYRILVTDRADAAARALHEATRLHRDLDADRPSTWAAHIHSGT